MRVVPGPGTGSEWYRLQTTTAQPRGGMVLLGVGQGQGVLLLQTTTFPEAPRQVNRCTLTDYYSGEAEKHPVPSPPPTAFQCACGPGGKSVSGKAQRVIPLCEKAQGAKIAFPRPWRKAGMIK